MKSEKIVEEITKTNSSPFEAHLLRSAVIAALVFQERRNPNLTPEQVSRYAVALYEALLILRPSEDWEVPELAETLKFDNVKLSNYMR